MSYDSHNKRILNDNKCDMKDNKTVIETGQWPQWVDWGSSADAMSIVLGC